MSDLISKKRIKFELGESNMPEKYRKFCLRVLDDNNLTPDAGIEEVNGRLTQIQILINRHRKEKINYEETVSAIFSLAENLKYEVK